MTQLSAAPAGALAARSSGRSSLCVELKAGKDSPAPTEFRIFAAGKNESTKGTFVFDDKAAKAVMAAAAERGVDIPIDYAHGTTSDLGQLNPEMAGKAAGWCSLELRDGELWAVNVRWTKAALAAIEAREWRYISPTFTHGKDNRPQVLLAIALENVPALHNLEPLVAAGATATEIAMLGWVPMCLGRSITSTSLVCQACAHKTLCASLCYGSQVPPDPASELTAAQFQAAAREGGAAWEQSVTAKATAAYHREHSMKTVLQALKLAETATEAEALAALTALQAQIVSANEATNKLVALTGKATLSEAAGALQALKAEADKTAALQAEIAGIKKAATDAKAEALIDAATKDGRLPPAKAEGARKLYADFGLPALETSLSMLSVVVTPAGGGQKPPAEEKGGQVAALSAEHQDIAARLGVDPAKAAALAKAEQAPAK